MLLEHYDDYCQRAKMITEIHAQAPKSATNAAEQLPDEDLDQPSSSKSKKLQDKVQENKKKEKLMKEKKRVLKRL